LDLIPSINDIIDDTDEDDANEAAADVIEEESLEETLL
jgi:hypothetical protein